MLQRRHAGSTKSARGGAAAVMESLQPQKPAKNPRARSSSVADFEQDRAAEQTLRAFAMIAASDHRFATARNDRGQAGRAPKPTAMRYQTPAASLRRSSFLRSLGSSSLLRKRMAFGVTSTSSSSLI